MVSLGFNLAQQALPLRLGLFAGADIVNDDLREMLSLPLQTYSTDGYWNAMAVARPKCRVDLRHRVAARYEGNQEVLAMIQRFGSDEVEKISPNDIPCCRSEHAQKGWIR